MIKGMKLLVTGAALAVGSNLANAAATMSIYDGVNPLISLTDGGLGDLNSSIGGIILNTNVGVWTLTISSGTTKPLAGSATTPVMDLSIQALSTAAGSLRVTFSDNSFGPASGTLNALLSGHIVFGAPTTATLSVYGDPANVVGATTVSLATAGPGLLTGSAITGSGPLSLSTPFSLTEVVQFTAPGATYLSSDASFSVVPEPGLFAFSALGIAAWAMRRAGRKEV
jgi:hypothetical protein